MGIIFDATGVTVTALGVFICQPDIQEIWLQLFRIHLCSLTNWILILFHTIKTVVSAWPEARLHSSPSRVNRLIVGAKIGHRDWRWCHFLCVWESDHNLPVFLLRRLPPPTPNLPSAPAIRRRLYQQTFSFPRRHCPSSASNPPAQWVLSHRGGGLYWGGFHLCLFTLVESRRPEEAVWRAWRGHRWLWLQQRQWHRQLLPRCPGLSSTWSHCFLFVSLHIFSLYIYIKHPLLRRNHM